MTKKNWLTGVCWGLLGLVIGGGLAVGLISHTPRYVPPLQVIGDVLNSYTLHDLHGIAKMEQVTFQGNRYKAVKMSDIINKAEPVPSASQLYLFGADGFIAAIKAQGIDDCYIAYTAKNGWEAVNLYHPINSNTKQLTKIVVVSDGSSGDFAFNVIDQNSDLAQLTPGQLLTGSLTQYPYQEGKAVVRNGGKDYESQVFTIHHVFKLNDVTPVKDGDHLLLMGEKGECRLVDNSGYFEVKDNHVNYFHPDTRIGLEKVRGVIVRPPAASIMDTYYAVKHYLNGGDKLLVVVLDGLTYRQYSYAAANGYAPFLKSCGTAVKASGVYPLDNNVGLAAILTGKSNEENGITTEKDRRLKTHSIFAEVNKSNKKALYLEAGPKMLDTEAEPVTITDRNGNGSADDELSDAVQSNLSKGYDLIMARYHGINDAGQSYGVVAQPTLQTISLIDHYLAEIIGKWPGKVIITGNQGTRSGQLTGTEATFSNDAMFVPYWRLQ